MNRSSTFPPPPVVFLRDPGLLPRIRSEITGPPDPEVLPWEPLAEYDEGAVVRRQRLEKAAREKKAEAEARAQAEPAPETRTQVASAFRGTPPRLEGQVDFSTAGSFFQKAHVAAPPRRAEGEPGGPEPAEEPPSEAGPAFGFAQGGRPRRKPAEKEPEVRKRPRAVEGDFLARLKTEFRKSD